MEWDDPIESLNQAFKTYDSSIHGRMTDLVGFMVPINVDVLIPIMSGTDYKGDAPLPNTAIDPELIKVVNESLPLGVEYQIFQASVGRGASGYGAAIEVVKWLSEAGGFEAGLLTIAKSVQILFDGLRKRLASPLVISLGAAKYLAAANLIDKLGDDNFYLHGAGDTYSAAPDRSYTGLDLFWVAFRKKGRLYLYTVTSHGDAKLAAEIDLEPKEIWGEGG